MNQADDEIVARGKRPKRKSFLGIMFEEIIVKNFNEMKTTFVDEVLIPQTMDWLYDLGTDFLSGILQSSKSAPRRSGSSLFGRTTDYGSRFRSSARGRRERRDEREEDIRDYEEISFDTRQHAEKVLAKMIGAIEDYKMVTVRDLMTWSGLKTTWTDEKFGWTDLNSARSYRGKDGRYYLDLPEPRPIEDD